VIFEINLRRIRRRRQRVRDRVTWNRETSRADLLRIAIGIATIVGKLRREPSPWIFSANKVTLHAHPATGRTLVTAFYYRIYEDTFNRALPRGFYLDYLVMITLRLLWTYVFAYLTGALSKAYRNFRFILLKNMLIIK